LRRPRRISRSTVRLGHLKPLCNLLVAESDRLQAQEPQLTRGESIESIGGLVPLRSDVSGSGASPAVWGSSLA
jgi:hypothetical protein